MQLQQLRGQNDLLQQLVQTLQREIQSKNQQQNIMIQQLQHLIKDNDALGSKYNLLLGQSRKWNDKEKYYEKLIREVEETLVKTRAELGEYKKKVDAQSQQLLIFHNSNSTPNSNPATLNPSSIPLLTMPLTLNPQQTYSQSSPQIQVYSPSNIGTASNHPNVSNNLIIPNNQTNSNNNSKVPSPMHVPSHLYVSVPKIMNPPGQQLQQGLFNTNNGTNQQISNNQSNTSFQTVSQQGSSSHQSNSLKQQGANKQASPQQQKSIQPQLLKKLQAQIRCLKSSSQTLKLQQTHRDLQLKSKTQKLKETTQQLHHLQDQLQSFKDIIDDLRKENSQLLKDLQVKQQEIQQKDEKFFQMYKEMDDEWKGKWEKLQQDRKMMQYKTEDARREVEVREEELKNLKENFRRVSEELEQKGGEIEGLVKEIDGLREKIEGGGVKEEEKMEKQKIEKIVQGGQQSRDEPIVPVDYATTGLLTVQPSNHQQQETYQHEQMYQLRQQLTLTQEHNLTLTQHLRSLAAQIQHRKSQLIAVSSQLHCSKRANTTLSIQLNDILINIGEERESMRQVREQMQGEIQRVNKENEELRRELRGLEVVFGESQEVVGQLQEEVGRLEGLGRGRRMEEREGRQREERRGREGREGRLQGREGREEREGGQQREKREQGQEMQERRKIQQRDSIQQQIKRCQQLVQQQEQQRLQQQQSNQQHQHQQQSTPHNHIYPSLQQPTPQQPPLQQAPAQQPSPSLVVISQLQQQNAQLKQQINELVNQFQEMGSGFEEMSRHVNQVEQQLERKNKELEDVKETYQGERENRKGEMEERQRERVEMNREREERQRGMQERERRIVEENGELGERVKQLQERLSQLDKEKQEFEDEKQELDKEKQQEIQLLKQHINQSQTNNNHPNQPPSNPNPYSLQPQVQPPPCPSTTHPKSPNHIELEMFQLLQREYTQLQQESESTKQQLQSQITSLLEQAKRKDHEIRLLNKKVQDLTGLFRQKNEENEELLRRSVGKSDRSGKEGGMKEGRVNKEVRARENRFNQEVLTRENRFNQEESTFKPSPHPIPIHLTPIPSFSIPLIRPKSNHYTQNLVQNKLSSPRSHQQMNDNQQNYNDYQDQDDIDYINENGGFDIKIQPQQRKSDLPLHSSQFMENVSSNNNAVNNKNNVIGGNGKGTIRPKSNFIETSNYNSSNNNNHHIHPISNTTRQPQHLLEPQTQIDINYLRNSIAQFGLDIDFNAIAKHIGLSVDDDNNDNQEEQLYDQERQEELTEKKHEYKQLSQFVPHRMFTQTAPEHMMDVVLLESQQEEGDSRVLNKEHYESGEIVMTSKEGFHHKPSPYVHTNGQQANYGSQRKQHTMHSSYGSNPSQTSQKRSVPGALRIPHVDQQLMRSSYGSNNQFTQIVLYYQEQLSKLRQKLSQLTEQISKQKQQKEERVYSMQMEVRELHILMKQKDERLEEARKENLENVERIEEMETMLGEMRNELELKEREEYGREIEERLRMREEGHEEEHPPCRPAPSLPLPQTTQFRTSIQPRIAMNHLSQPPISLTPEQQQQTVQLIAQLSTQLEAIQERLTESEQQCIQERKRSGLLNEENIGLVRELELLKKDEESLVRQFSEMSLQQNLDIANMQNENKELTQQVERLHSELTKLKEDNQHLLKINNQLFQQHTLQTQQKLHNLTQQLTSQFDLRLKHTVDQQLDRQKIQFIEEFNKTRRESMSLVEKRNKELELKVKEKEEVVERLVGQVTEREKEKERVERRVGEVEGQLGRMGEEKTHLGRVIEEKDSTLKKLQRSLKQSKEQCSRLSNQNQTLAREFSRLLKVTKQFQNLSKRHTDLQLHNKSLQQAIAKLTLNQQNDGSESPISFTRQRISDLLDPSTNPHMQTFSINNISNIHAIVDQLGDDSFSLQHKDHEIAALRETIEKLKREIEEMREEVRDRDVYAGEMEDRLAVVDNQYNKEIMHVKKLNAELNAELLKLKKQLFNYQKDNGQIQKFIQENFLNDKLIGDKLIGDKVNTDKLNTDKINTDQVKDKEQKDQMNPQKKRFSAQGYHGVQSGHFPQSLSQFQPSTSQQFKNHPIHSNKSQKNNNSFHYFQSHNSQQMSTLSARNRHNQTQLYYPRQFYNPKQCYNPKERECLLHNSESQQGSYNMGEMFMGRKTKPKYGPNNGSDGYNNTQNNNNNSLAQMIKNITSSNRHNPYSQTQRPKLQASITLPQTAVNRPGTSTYSKYLKEYEKYEQKIKQENKNNQPSYGNIKGHSSAQGKYSMEDYKDYKQ